MREKLSTDQLGRLQETAVRAAQAAAVPIQAYFGGQHVEVQQKGDGSPVTLADQEAEALIRGQLLSNSVLGPLDILGEEEGLQGAGTRWRWIVDPIDGTRSFIHGIPLFGTIIALLDTEENQPVVGVIHLPMLGQTYAAARGLGATCQGTRMDVSGSCSLTDAIIGVGDIAQFASANRLSDYERLQSLSGYVRGYTDCFGHGLVISGALGAMLDPALNPWDILATQVLVEEANGTILLSPSSVPGKVDALFGNSNVVEQLARELKFS
ncbi:MAG: histidinol-phosphatase [Nitrospirota bacterium]|nr:histidinol-phosphatase [Nitrospirota bacterium]MDH5588319.1 histidinol-phosphatase [Nitrospirota bacterium]MDH5773535.1 histidinol-phosphatase [Nitrospirota bacterium]